MNVTVTGQEGADGSLIWTINGDPPGKSELSFPKNSGSQLIHYVLDDQTNRGFEFHQTDPFWAAKDLGACPPSGSSCDQTTVQSCNGKQLVVHNKNSGAACTVNYQLNLVDAESNAVEVDPIIKNGGSG